MSGNSRKIIVGVDFGTTMSGVAFCATARPEVQIMIEQWPDRHNKVDGITSVKVPSEVVYDDDGQGFRCGNEIYDDEKRYQWFKMELDPTHLVEASHLSIKYPDPKALSVGWNVSAIDLTVDFLSWLCRHTVLILKLKLGEGLIESTPIHYVLTVPAIWSEKAKWTTRLIAKQAGMGDSVGMISEPEAAVIYSLDTMDPHGLIVGDNFVLCDAGGGTVDLISYSIITPKPVTVREAAPGSGSACGSTFVNRIFHRTIREIVQGNTGFDEDTLEEALSRFETSIKRNFDGSSDDIQIPVPGLVNDPSKRIARGKLMISATLMRQIFDPVISTIITLIQAQIKVTGNVKAVLLVGGFGQNPYLRNSVQKVVDRKIDVMQPPHGQSAIARGALLHGLADNLKDGTRIRVASRVARFSYCTDVSRTFDGSKHCSSRKAWSDYRGEFRVTVNHWFLRKGELICQEQPIKLCYCYFRRVSDGAFKSISPSINYVDGDDVESLPIHPEKNDKKLLELKADLSTIPTWMINQSTGADGLLYYKLNIEIHVNHFSGSTEYSLWYKERCYSKVTADYA